MLLTLITTSGSSLFFTKVEYTWTQLTPRADFPGSYNFQLFTHDDHIWAFHSQGVWSSIDGRTWSKTGLTDIVNNQAFLDYIEFRKSVYGLGTFHGNIEHFTQTSQISRTSDFKHWEVLAKSSNLPKRFFYHPFVFRDKMWIIGGSDGRNKFSDAWTSGDGVHWEKTADNLPFGKRAGQHFVVFNDSLYMLDYDAWVSPDGITWNQCASRIAEGDIYGYSVEIYDHQLWLIGCNRSAKFDSEVIRSPDGRNWKSERAPWSPRGAVATCIFNDRIIMTGGKYGGQDPAHPVFIYSNDVWALGKPLVPR